MFLFLFFSFHDLDLELGLPLFSFWLKNHVIFVVFIPVILLMLNLGHSFSFLAPNRSSSLLTFGVFLTCSFLMLLFPIGSYWFCCSLLMFFFLTHSWCLWCSSPLPAFGCSSPLPTFGAQCVHYYCSFSLSIPSVLCVCSWCSYSLFTPNAPNVPSDYL